MMMKRKTVKPKPDEERVLMYSIDPVGLQAVAVDGPELALQVIGELFQERDDDLDIRVTVTKVPRRVLDGLSDFNGW